MKKSDILKSKVTISEREMLDDYFFARRDSAPSAVKVDLTHWNCFGELDQLFDQVAEECGPVLESNLEAMGFRL